MIEVFRAWVLGVLRIPTQPTLPTDAREVRVFRASRNYFRYRLVLWAVTQVAAVIGLLSGLLVLGVVLRGVNDSTISSFVRGIEMLAWAGFLAQLPFSYAVLRLDYELRWYILTDRCLRIREGTVRLREKTLTYANIQNLSVRQNPLQRMLGIADVNVRTAGGGSSAAGKQGAEAGETMHEAWFRGVDNAEEILGQIRGRVRLHRDAGLGDPDDSPAAIASAPEVLLAAHELRTEARSLLDAAIATRRPPLTSHSGHSPLVGEQS
jgi:uncharacterized membrane protein YdbT with pleckstrin-like domain